MRIPAGPPRRVAWPALLIAAAAAPAAAQTVPPFGPPPGWRFSEVDVCAVAAIAERPSRSPAGAGTAGRRDGIHDTARWYLLDWRFEGGRLHGPWGSCRAPAPSRAFFFSADRRYALAEYESDGALPLGGEWGYCVYEKAAGRWRLVGCRITALS